MSGALAFWKTAHILSAAVLFGTGLGIAFCLMVAKPLAVA